MDETTTQMPKLADYIKAGYIPTLEQYTTAGYKAETYDAFVTSRYAEAEAHPELYPMTASDVPTLYQVHSTVRARHTRTLRAANAMTNRHRFKQHVMTDQRRLVRGRPLTITESQLFQHLGEFIEREQMGVLEIRTGDGRKVDLKTMLPMPASPVGLQPHPIPDSLANDTPTGYKLPKYPGEKPLTEQQVTDVLSGMASVDGELEVNATTGQVEIVPTAGATAPVQAEETDIPPPPNLPNLDEDEEADIEHKDSK